MTFSILLIDDDYSTNLYHEIILSESKIVERVDICESTDEAINYLGKKGKKPDLILLDINMPIKSGWEFLKEYLELFGGRPPSKLVILSTTKMDEDVVRAMEHPAVDAFDTKPLTSEKISTYLKNLTQ